VGVCSRRKRITGGQPSLYARGPKSLTVGNAVLSVPKNRPSGTTVPTESLPCINKAKLLTVGNGLDRSAKGIPRGQPSQRGRGTAACGGGRGITKNPEGKNTLSSRLAPCHFPSRGSIQHAGNLQKIPVRFKNGDFVKIQVWKQKQVFHQKNVCRPQERHPLFPQNEVPRFRQAAARR